MKPRFELDAELNGEINPTRAPRGAGTLGRACRPANAPAQRALPLLLGPLLCAAGLAVTANAQAVGETTRVSVNSWGIGGNSHSFDTSLSADGRFVAFDSDADNLVPDDTNDFWDVFVHDRQTRRTTRVSVDASGKGTPDDESGHPVLSADGRVVAFWSWATNLVPDDTNGQLDAFVHDRATHQTTRVSVDSAGNQANNGTEAFVGIAISANGRFVAFESESTNLVPDDTNGELDIFVHDRTTRQTSRVSVDSTGAQGDASSPTPAISANGRFVAFYSFARNLVPDDTNGQSDVFVHDRQTHQTSRVSVDSTGTQGNANSGTPAISADGRFVAFKSESTNLVPDDTNGQSDVFVYDRTTHQTSRVSIDSTGAQGDEYSTAPAISADGRFVAFHSFARNLVPGDNNGFWDVFVHDRQTHQTSRASVDSNGNEGGQSSARPDISDDGRFVAFDSYARKLVPGGTTGINAIFVRDRLLDRSATADLAVRQTVSPSPFLPTSPITYTVKVINNGPDAAREVTLVDGPLRGRAVTSRGTCSNGAPLVCYLGMLAAGASATVTLTLSPRGTGTPRVYNAAQVSAAPLDPHRANNKTGLHATAAP